MVEKGIRKSVMASTGGRQTAKEQREKGADLVSWSQGGAGNAGDGDHRERNNATSQRGKHNCR